MIRRLRRLSLKTKLLVLMVGMTVAVAATAVWQVRQGLQAMAASELSKRSLALARELSLRVTDPLLSRDFWSVKRIIDDLIEHNPDLSYAFVTDGAGRLVAHSFDGGFPRDLLTQRPDEGELMELDSDQGRLYDARVPIALGRAGHVRLGLAQSALDEAMIQVEARQLAAVLTASAVGIFAAYLLVSALGRRLSHLTQAARTVEAGDYAVRVATDHKDELGQLAVAFNEMTAQLAAARAEVEAKEEARNQLLQRLLTAQEEERSRISRELHDEIGQALTGLLVRLKVAEGEAAPVAELRSLVAETLESVRHLSRELRPPVLDDMGLVPALRRHVNDFCNVHSIKGNLEVIGHEAARLEPTVETTLYRVVQEALTNVARHSGARHVGVLLDLRPPLVTAIIEDDGQGFDPTSPRVGLGLAGMRERAQLVGGQLIIESRPGGGTTIFVKVPIGADQAENPHRR